MPEETAASKWLAEAPKLPDGKVDVRLLIALSDELGYCVCPKPLRQMIDMSGFRCAWCGRLETEASWKWWYEPLPKSGE